MESLPPHLQLPKEFPETPLRKIKKQRIEFQSGLWLWESWVLSPLNNTKSGLTKLNSKSTADFMERKQKEKRFVDFLNDQWMEEKVSS